MSIWPFNNKSKGFTLLEVMIAIFVLAVGLLGVAALQATGSKNNQTAFLRTQSIQNIYNLADRIRANVAGAQSGDYVASAAPVITYDCMSNFSNTTIVNKCSATEMAKADLVSWFASISANLPGGSGRASCSDLVTTDGDACSKGSLYTISVSWNERVTAAEDATGFVTKSFSMDFQP